MNSKEETLVQNSVERGREEKKVRHPHIAQNSETKRKMSITRVRTNGKGESDMRRQVKLLLNKHSSLRKSSSQARMKKWRKV